MEEGLDWALRDDVMDIRIRARRWNLMDFMIRWG